MSPRRLVRSAVATTTLLCLGACGTVEVRVNAFLSSSIDFPRPGLDRIHVCAETQPRNGLFEAEITAQVEHMLADRGFTPTDNEDDGRDYVLACWVGADDGTRRIGTDVYREPPHYRTTHVITPRGRSLTVRTYLPGIVHHVPYSYTVFQRRMTLFLHKADAGETTQQADASASIAWQATAQSPGSRPHLRQIVPYLLVAAFEHWEKDSQQERSETFQRTDERIKRLRAPRSAQRAGDQ